MSFENVLLNVECDLFTIKYFGNKKDNSPVLIFKLKFANVHSEIQHRDAKSKLEPCTFISAAIIMGFSFILTLTSLSLVHERVPNYEPLPDVFLDNVPAHDWALDVSEYIIIICVNTSILAMVFHKHR